MSQFKWGCNMIPVGEKFFMDTKYVRGKDLTPSRVIKIPEAYKEYTNVPTVFLPAPVVGGGESIWDVIRKRRSKRRYVPDILSQKELSQLLWATQGITGRVSGFLLRSAPSAGALYPIETYLWIHRVEDLSMGIYHFNVKRFCLEMIRGGNYSTSLKEACLGQHMLSTCAVAFIWTAVIDRCRVKYGERAFRYIFMDVGHICQNLYLAATAMGLGCCAIGAFFDDEVNQILGLDGMTESVIYIATVGKLT